MKSGSLTLDEVARLWVEAGGGVLPVSGRSMRPTFEDASAVRMETAGRVRRGDILVYTNGSFLVVHRVVGIRAGPSYRTKGDGLPHLDPHLVPASQVLGRVIELERAGRRYRMDTFGGRLYASLAAALSAVEGFLYRFAYRLDRSLTSARRPGVTVLRRSLGRVGRTMMALLDRGVFAWMHPAETEPRRTR